MAKIIHDVGIYMGRGSQDTSIVLNGVDISTMVRGFRIEHSVGKPVVLSLDLVPSRVTIFGTAEIKRLLEG